MLEWVTAEVLAGLPGGALEAVVPGADGGPFVRRGRDPQAPGAPEAANVCAPHATEGNTPVVGPMPPLPVFIAELARDLPGDRPAARS